MKTRLKDQTTIQRNSSCSDKTESTNINVTAGCAGMLFPPDRQEQLRINKPAAIETFAGAGGTAESDQAAGG